MDKSYNLLVENSNYFSIMSSLYQCDMVIGMNHINSILDSNDKLTAKKDIDTALNGERTTTVNKYGKKDYPQYFETIYTPIYTDHEIVGCSVVSQDVTDYKNTQDSLKKSEYFFEESQRAALIGSYQSEFYPNDVWETSEVCDEIFGIDNSYNKTVKGWTNCLHPDDAKEMIDYVTKDVIGNGVYGIESLLK